MSDMTHLCDFCGSFMRQYDTKDLEMNGNVLLRCECCGRTKLISEEEFRRKI